MAWRAEDLCHSSRSSSPILSTTCANSCCVAPDRYPSDARNIRRRHRPARPFPARSRRLDGPDQPRQGCCVHIAVEPQASPVGQPQLRRHRPGQHGRCSLQLRETEGKEVSSVTGRPQTLLLKVPSPPVNLRPPVNLKACHLVALSGVGHRRPVSTRRPHDLRLLAVTAPTAPFDARNFSQQGASR